MAIHTEALLHVSQQANATEAASFATSSLKQSTMPRLAGSRTWWLYGVDMVYFCKTYSKKVYMFHRRFLEYV